MGKLTYVLENTASIDLARVVLDGTDVHASHPEDVHRLVRFPSANDKAALETFQKVVQKYFHPRDGWRLKEKKAGVADLSNWAPPPPSAEELRRAQELKDRRMRGFAVEGDVMVIDLKRQGRQADLEIAFEGASHVVTLGLITNDGDDVRGAWRMPSASALLADGALPRLRELTLECPFETAGRVAQWPLHGLATLLQKVPALETLSIVGTFEWPHVCQFPKLRILRVLSDPLSQECLERIAASRAPVLEAVQLGLRVEQPNDPAAEAMLVRLLKPTLQHLSIEGLSDVAAGVELIAQSGRPLPAELCVDGAVADDDALVDALKRARKKAPKTAILLGKDARATISAETAAACDALKIGTFPSRFAPEAVDPRLQALWQAFV